MRGVSQPLAQDWFEFSNAIEHARGASAVLEIGSRFGKSLEWLGTVSAKGSKLVSIDLPIDPYSQGVDVHGPLTRVCEKLSLHGHDVHQITGDSHDPNIVKKVEGLGPFDFGFIDGDHTYDGVRRDWLAYGPLCDIAAFHDINSPDWGVKRLWNEIKCDHPHAEYVAGKMGIGVLFRTIPKFDDARP